MWEMSHHFSLLCIRRFLTLNLQRLISQLTKCVFGHFGWWVKHTRRFFKFLQKYTSSRPETAQSVYTDILVAKKTVKISAGRALLYFRELNERTSKIRCCIFWRNYCFVRAPTKTLATVKLPSVANNLICWVIFCSGTSPDAGSQLKGLYFSNGWV